MKLALLIIFGVLAFPASPSPYSSGISLGSAASVLDESLRMTPAPQGTCVQCPYNSVYCFLLTGDPSHQTATSPTGNVLNPHSYCLLNPAGGACSGHPLCLGFSFLGEDPAARLRELAVQLADGQDVLQELLLRFPGNVETITERNAVAVRSCGKIIAFRELTLAPIVAAGGLLE